MTRRIYLASPYRGDVEATATGAAFMPMSAACHAVAVDFDDFDVDCG